jgi:hypothetical protein
MLTRMGLRVLVPLVAGALPAAADDPTPYQHRLTETRVDQTRHPM